MAETRRPVPTGLLACITHDRAPSVQELHTVAARIWTESSAERSAFAWERLDPRSSERAIALRVALAAVNGSEA